MPSCRALFIAWRKKLWRQGGQALAIQLDVRDELAIHAAVEQAAAHFGGIDVLVNNASAISLTPTLQTTAKRLDLMWDVNMRATFLASQACIPHLKKAGNPHILTLSPPLNFEASGSRRMSPIPSRNSA